MSEPDRVFDPAIPRAMYTRVFGPSLLSALTLSLANVADALVVGQRMGETGLAAIGLVTPIYLLYNLLGASATGGGSITHAQLTAAGKREDALAHFRHLAAMLLGISLVIAALGNGFMGAVLNLLGAREDYASLRSMVEIYARPLLGAAPVFMLNFLLYDFVRADDNPRLAALGFTAGCTLDLTLNILFVLILRWGVAGAIWATVISQSVSVGILSTHLFGRRGVLRLKAVLQARPMWQEARAATRNSLRVGFATSLRFLLQFAFLMMGNHLLLDAGRRGLIDGNLYVAVFDLIMNVSYLACSVWQAASESMQPLAATFHVEHDQRSLQYVLKLSLGAGLATGLALSGALALGARPVAALFGLGAPLARRAAEPAIRIYLLSTPLAGVLTVMTAYYQSTEQVRISDFTALMRNGVCLLPLTLIAGLFLPERFWWVFPLAETLSALVLGLWWRWRKKHARRREIPVCSAMMTNDSHELSQVVERVSLFCEEQEVPMKISVQLQLAVEELCAVTMEKAFSGQKGELIQVTLAAEPDGRYVLHIRNTAPYFNPLDLRMGRAQADMGNEILDSIGVMMVRKQAKALLYRNYQGYNVLTAIF